MNGSLHIFVTSINFQKLDKFSDQLLSEVSINNSEDTLGTVRAHSVLRLSRSLLWRSATQ
jgi:hypothetical protein